jgi:hypothetical protein
MSLNRFKYNLQQVKIKLSRHFIPYTLGFMLMLSVFMGFSALPWMIIYLRVGRFIGVNICVEFLVLFLLVIAVFSISVLALIKLKQIGAVLAKIKWVSTLSTRAFVLSLVLSFLVIFAFSAVFMPQVQQAGTKIDSFVAENKGLSFHDYVVNVSSFLENNVRCAYNKPEASFRIDILLSSTLLDPYIMRFYGVTRADLIVYQGWGSCEQAAILIDQLLHDAGYETRQAHFKGNVDHGWAEVKYNGTWLIVDPWYIGNFVSIQNLKTVKPEFQQATGVEVQYDNGTTIDSSYEHGY